MKEARIHDRVRCHLEFSCRSYFDTAGNQIYFDVPAVFEVLNLSVGGVLAKSTFKVEKDMVLHYTFYLEDMPYIIMSRVRWSEEVVDGYAYGLEFLTIPNMLHRHLHEYTTRLTTKN